jgi:hypothetical protein
MRYVFVRILWRAMAVVAGLVLLTGCDPTTQAAVENGVINASTSWLGALLQAWIATVGAQTTT